MYKKFISYYSPYKKVFTADLFCAAILSLIDISIPLFISYMINTVYVNTDISYIISKSLQICGILLILYIVRMLCNYFVAYYGHVMGSRMETDMRKDLFDKLSRLSFSFYDKNNTGQMISRLINDLFDITELAHHGPENIFISTLKLIGAFILLMSINSLLTFSLIIVVIFMFFFSKKCNEMMKNNLKESKVRVGNINESAQDSLAGIRVVQSFANEKEEKKKFNVGNMAFLEAKRKFYRTMGIYTGVNSFFQGLMYIVVFSVGTFSILNGTMNPGDIVAFILYINMFLEPIKMLINFTEMYQKGYTGFKRMHDILELEDEVKERKNPVEICNFNGNINFNNVSFSYEENKDILKDLTISIKSGSTVALVGPSGGGKTTFCSLIPRFYDATNGSVTINGVNVRELKLRDLRKNVGVVQQDVYIFGTSIKENIAYGKLDATIDEIVDAAKKANIHDYIMSLDDGYDTKIGERGVRFSGGQKQRLSIARVFLKNPPILILDEATAALDNESEKYIQESLEELSKNRTTIVIAHRLSTIRNANEIYVLTEDGLIESGTHDELIKKNGKYANLYNMQFNIN
ncbi:MAG: ABC transporter ATP-binding protein [Lachnospirales bacterium]